MNKNFMTFDEWFKSEVKNKEDAIKLYRGMHRFYIDSLGLNVLDDEFPEPYMTEYKKAINKRKEIFNSFTLDDLRKLFRISHKQEKGHCLDRMRQLGASEEFISKVISEE